MLPGMPLALAQQLIREVMFDVWPDNHQSWAVFQEVSDQWIMGPGGPVAINMLAVYPVVDDMELSRHDRRELLSDIRYLGSCAVGQILENSEKK